MDLVTVDIGGTHARFAIAGVAADGTIALGEPETLHTRDHASFQTAWEDFRARRGGTGAPADWTAAARLAGGRRILLAGGLNAENVAEALQTVQPFGIDVSSGVECAPGIKDRGRMRDLFAAVRAAHR